MLQSDMHACYTHDLRKYCIFTDLLKALDSIETPKIISSSTDPGTVSTVIAIIEHCAGRIKRKGIRKAYKCTLG